MKQKRKKFCLLSLILTFGLVGTISAQPIFENQTPKGFSASDSTAQTDFETESTVSILVDLNQPASAEYPVTGNFQKLERAVPYFDDGNADPAQHMSQAIAVDETGVIHRAWVQRRGFASNGNKIYTTAAYGVVYAKVSMVGRPLVTLYRCQVNFSLTPSPQTVQWVVAFRRSIWL